MYGVACWYECVSHAWLPDHQISLPSCYASLVSNLGVAPARLFLDAGNVAACRPSSFYWCLVADLGGI
jgi:hypothetical protein